jgi:hypothetical protein
MKTVINKYGISQFLKFTLWLKNRRMILYNDNDGYDENDDNKLNLLIPASARTKQHCTYLKQKETIT